MRRSVARHLWSFTILFSVLWRASIARLSHRLNEIRRPGHGIANGSKEDYDIRGRSYVIERMAMVHRGKQC